VAHLQQLAAHPTSTGCLHVPCGAVVVQRGAVVVSWWYKGRPVELTNNNVRRTCVTPSPGMYLLAACDDPPFGFSSLMTDQLPLHASLWARRGPLWFLAVNRTHAHVCQRRMARSPSVLEPHFFGYLCSMLYNGMGPFGNGPLMPPPS
jgi:hypothetical protein